MGYADSLQGIFQPPFLLTTGDEYDARIAKCQRSSAHFTSARKRLVGPGGRITAKLDGKLRCRAPSCIVRPRFQAAQVYADPDLRLETIGVDLKIAQKHGHPWCVGDKPLGSLLCADENGTICHSCAAVVAMGETVSDAMSLPLCTTCKSAHHNSGGSGVGAKEAMVATVLQPLVNMWGGSSPVFSKMACAIEGAGSVQPDIRLVRCLFPEDYAMLYIAFFG